MWASQSEVCTSFWNLHKQLNWSAYQGWSMKNSRDFANITAIFVENQLRVYTLRCLRLEVMELRYWAGSEECEKYAAFCA